MKRPTSRAGLPPRKSDNEKRRLLDEPSPRLIAQLLRSVTYGPSAKHKRTPHLYGLDPFTGERGDATLCDRDARFGLRHVKTIPALIRRGIQAGLIGHTEKIIWPVSDDGWIFEGRETNRVSLEFHGYPVRSNEAIVEPVLDRFAEWAGRHGSKTERAAARACRNRYM